MISSIVNALRRHRDRIPLGILHDTKPRHFRAILETLADNAGHWHEMWRVLNGPCNGCAVQTDGLRDNVMPNAPHFCLVRLGLIEEALRRPFDPARFADVSRLRRRSNAQIEALGRIPVPLLRRRGMCGFSPVSFDEANGLAAEWIGANRGDRCGFFTTSKGVCNEEYYVFQQFARLAGFTHNVDSCARQCHAASVAALKRMLGIGASSGTLSDFMSTDLLILAGTNLANNQPLVMRYIVEGRQRRGGLPRVIVVNSVRETGLERYWVPSSPRSALFGTRIADHFVRVRVGGDAAFFNGVLKVLIQESLLGEGHRAFIGRHTTGWESLQTCIASQSFETLESQSGVPRAEMAHMARELARTPNVVYVWGMGLTQHAHGTDNVASVVNVALALGHIGRPHAGVAALRGQSSVQAAGECGVAPNTLPGGETLTPEAVVRLSRLWGGILPDAVAGLPTGPLIEAAHAGQIGCLVSLGGNLVDTLPARGFVREALSRVPFRIKLDVMMNHETLVEPGEAVLVIPVRNWYEWDSVFTTTSTDRTIRAFTGAIQPRSAGVQESWRVMGDIARLVSGRANASPPFTWPDYHSTDDIRAAMQRDIWMYDGITQLDRPHRFVQWGGATLFTTGFERMPDGKAAFAAIEPANRPIPPGHVQVSTRRGFGQWNSQHRWRRAKRDSFTAARTLRDVLMHPDDAARWNLVDGAEMALVAESGAHLNGVCRHDSGQLAGHVQVFWPAANDLIPGGGYDKPSSEPDYNVMAKVEAPRRPPE